MLRTTTLRTSIGLAALTALLAPSISAQVEHLAARLTGDQENPPIATAAGGWGIVRVDSATQSVSIFVNADGIPATLAHLHRGGTGVNGPVVIPLQGGPQIWTGTGALSAADIQLVLQGSMYLNVHSAAFPGGEIRGQVTRTRSTRLIARIDGTQEVPPTPSLATATFVGFLHQPDNVIVYEVDARGLSAVAAHIHRGPVGQNGPVAYPLNGGGTRYCGVTSRLSAADLGLLFGNGLYVNLHTSSFPGGEIRGLLVSEQSQFGAALDGSQENPPVPTAARGIACIEFNPDRTLRYREQTNVANVTASHIHRGAVGTNGPVIFPFTGGPAVFQGTTAPLTAAQEADLRGGLYYVNVHSTANPGGEIRGQLSAVPQPTTFGGGCAGSSGRAPEIGASATPCPGASSDIELFGAAPNALAAFSLGLSRDGFGGLSLPFSLAVINMNGCYLLHDQLLGSFASSTDGLGCATFPLVLPFIPGVGSVQLYGQWFVVDAGANPLNVVASNGLDAPTQ